MRVRRSFGICRCAGVVLYSLTCEFGGWLAHVARLARFRVNGVGCSLMRLLAIAHALSTVAHTQADSGYLSLFGGHPCFSSFASSLHGQIQSEL